MAKAASPSLKDQLKQTQELLQRETASNAELHQRAVLAEQERAAAKVHADDISEKFTDLKKRIVAAEQANQYLRGYIARVQEDDVVREELLTVGEPDGEQRMVPKRKLTTFERPEDFMEPKPSRNDIYSGGYHERNIRKKPVHFISY